jgi:hypothetical protein
MEIKKPYETPRIEVIVIDNEISFVLTTPPSGPGEGKSFEEPDNDEEEDMGIF